jgi:hypothetical protein
MIFLIFGQNYLGELYVSSFIFPTEVFEMMTVDILFFGPEVHERTISYHGCGSPPKLSGPLAPILALMTLQEFR